MPDDNRQFPDRRRFLASGLGAVAGLSATEGSPADLKKLDQMLSEALPEMLPLMNGLPRALLVWFAHTYHREANGGHLADHWWKAVRKACESCGQQDQPRHPESLSLCFACGTKEKDD